MAGLQKQRKREDDTIDIDVFRSDLLFWYKHNAREMPWRAAYGKQPDPYHEWLSEIMLQQTVVKTVIPYFYKFIERWPTIHDLAAASEEEILREWAGLGYYARARNLYKCAQVVSSEYNGKFPEDEKSLQALPGIGPYTAAAISAIAFNYPSSVMDGNVERVMTRLHAHSEPISKSKLLLHSYVRDLTHARTDHPGDFAQALMELGAVICVPKNPKCDFCPVRRFCKAYAYKIQGRLPLKSVKKVKPKRYGVVYLIENEYGEIVFEKRPAQGLLASMPGIPGSGWEEKKADDLQNFKFHGVTLIKRTKDEVRHIFTHFDLYLSFACAKIAKDDILLLENEFWCSKKEYDKLGLPNLYIKVVTQYLD